MALKHAPGGSRVGRAPCRSSGSKSATDCVPRCRRTRSPSQDCADGHGTMADAASRVAHSTGIRKWSTRTASCTPAIDARSGVCGQLLSLPGSRPCCGRLLGRSLLRATTALCFGRLPRRNMPVPADVPADRPPRLRLVCHLTRHLLHLALHLSSKRRPPRCRWPRRTPSSPTCGRPPARAAEQFSW